MCMYMNCAQFIAASLAAAEHHVRNILMHKAGDIFLWLGSTMISYDTTGLSVTVENYCAVNVKQQTEP